MALAPWAGTALAAATRSYANRGAYGKNLGDPMWEGFIAELCAESESFASLWALNDAAVPASRTKSVRNLAVGSWRCF